QEIAAMRQNIEEAKDSSDADLVEIAPGYAFAELRMLFKQLEKELGGQQSGNGTSGVLEKIRSLLNQDHDEQHRIVDEVEKGSKEQMERLQRRLVRMAKDLQLSEAEVSRLRTELDVAYDGGVSSIYKNVQGLSENDTNVKAKKELLGKLFQANVELRKKLA
ncbi:MAG: hypothetical protein MI922_26155, partial [Bacteroidales bacterium]|nr:hypothetical protein [Bacteroidales bacterium]